MAIPSTPRNSLVAYIRQAWRGYFFYWVDKRAPLSHSHKLTHKNLYTFPNLQGFLFLILVLVIWVMGTNYQNNLILGLSYLLVSLFVVSILHAFANLAGISIRFISAQPAFAGDEVSFVLELSVDHQHGSEAIQLRWEEGAPEPISLKPGEPQRITLWLPSRERGYLRPGRLLVQSSFPLGIIRCWTWLRLDAKALIYPQPLMVEEPRAALGEGKEEGGGQSLRGDEFSGLRTYVPGDSIKHIAWKQYAQDKGLYTKEYQQLLSAEKWLDWDSLHLPQEERLSGLCYWALHYEQQHILYGLRLPGLQLVPDHGPNHLAAVLSALALFNLRDGH
jgi:uncharacterized protein (DUF58 family)